MQSCRKILEAKSIQIELTKIGTVAVYIDEFKYSSHTNKHNGWAERKTRIPQTISREFSSKLYNWVLFQRNTWSDGITTTFNSEKFVYFLKRITILLMIARLSFDIAARFTLQKKCRIIWETIIFDWLRSQLIVKSANVWEKLILIIKSRVRMEERKGKVANMQMFKKFIDSIKFWELQKWISESFKESSELIHKIIIPD